MKAPPSTSFSMFLFRGSEVISSHEEFLGRALREDSDFGLHPNHHLALRAKSQLISHYGNVPG